MFVYHFVDLDLRVEAFNANVWKNFMKISRKCLLSCVFFGWQKIAFKSFPDLNFLPSIIEFRMEEKIHTKAVGDVSRGAGGRIFLWEIRQGVSRNLSSQLKLYEMTWKWNLDQNLIIAWLFALCYFKSLQGKKYAVFLSKCVTWRFSRFWKCLNTTWNSAE